MTVFVPVLVSVSQISRVWLKLGGQLIGLQLLPCFLRYAALLAHSFLSVF